jgi:hypothetical protein
MPYEDFIMALTFYNNTNFTTKNDQGSLLEKKPIYKARIKDES